MHPSRNLLSKLAFVITLPVLATTGCNRPNNAAAADKTPAAKPQAKGTAVVVKDVGTGTVRRTVEVNGSLVSLRDVTLAAKMAGKVGSVMVREGDTVSAGQVVAVMDTIEAQAQLLQAQANLQSSLTREQQALAQLQQAKTGLETANTTLEWTRKTTRTAVEQAEAGLKQAEERLALVKSGARDQEKKQAEEQVRSAKANYDKAKSDLRRYQSLFKEQVISASQLESAQAAYDAAEAAYNSAREGLSLVREGARREDIRTAELAVDSARQSLARAQADRDQIRLREGDVKTATSGIRVAESALAAARAGTEQARAAVTIARNALTESAIRSPISGIVAERRAEPGMQLGAGGPVLRIVDTNGVYLQATLAESDYAEVKLGMPVEVRVDALPGVKFSGTVTRIFPVASSARSFSVRIDFTGDTRVRPQMFARGTITLQVKNSVVTAPKDAILVDPVSGKARAFVVKNGRAEERSITQGISTPTEVEILSGLQAGDSLIVQGQNGLRNGDAVSVSK
jgi:RND family efflux transporter MFP subunit